MKELFDAISKNNKIEVERLLLRKALDINEKMIAEEGFESEENTPLLMALSGERLEIALLILSHPKIDLSVCNRFGISAFHMLAMVGQHFEYTAEGKQGPLLSAGALEDKKHFGLIILEQLIALSTNPLVMINMPALDKRAPLDLAACHGFQEVIEAYEAMGAVSGPDVDETLLHGAIYSRKLEVIEYFSQVYPEQLAVTDQDGRIPVQLAIRYLADNKLAMEQVMTITMAFEPRLLIALDRYDQSLYQIACSAPPNLHAVLWLLAHDIEPVDTPRGSVLAFAQNQLKFMDEETRPVLEKIIIALMPRAPLAWMTEQKADIDMDVNQGLEEKAETGAKKLHLSLRNSPSIG